MGKFQGRDNIRGGGNFRGGSTGRSHDRPNFRDQKGQGRRFDKEVSMHKTVCSECHKDCEVPFRPSGDKPVYCSNCFSHKREDQDRGGKRNFSDKTSSFSSFPRTAVDLDNLNKQLVEINNKLDYLLLAFKNLNQLEEKKETKTLKPVLKKVVKVKDSSLKKIKKEKKIKK
jgi:CxxC-x17-CxxC domain-containing protein